VVVMVEYDVFSVTMAVMFMAIWSISVIHMLVSHDIGFTAIIFYHRTVTASDITTRDMLLYTRLLDTVFTCIMRILVFLTSEIPIVTLMPGPKR